MVQEQRKRRNHEEDATDEETVQHVGETATKQELDNDIDNILDEIDDVLESNAEEFVKSYIQKGGQ